jgi:hypothetical protein
MIVMPANSRGALIHYLAGRFGHLGHLYSPGGERAPYPWLPYALDNGAFPAWKNGQRWDADAYWRLLEWALEQRQAPRWILVPDVVADRSATLRSWAKWAPKLREFGWPLAFAAQDGMRPADVPTDADVVFLGGSTEWKREAIVPWCRLFRRVHVGRINTYDWLTYCERAGAESCDGTGWTRGDQDQLRGLVTWLEEANSGRKPAPLTALEIVPVQSRRGASASQGQTSLSFAGIAAPTARGGRSSSTAAPVACTGDAAPTERDR